MTKTDFYTQLQHYKHLIDADIESFAAAYAARVRKQYGAAAACPVDSYVSILQRGGKRVRGALVMVGYEMSGGTDQKMIIEAARAIEMFHAHMLVIDDIQDRSSIRRGGSTAHMQLMDNHITQNYSGDAEHSGTALAINGALAGLHAAETILTQLDVSPERRLGVLRLVNDTLQTTVHGQSHDIINGLKDGVTIDDVEQVMELKTANYSILNPLQVGMVLAGADADDLVAITEYAVHIGKAFQITDDIIGTFGTAATTHKNPMDDIREGKQTLLTVYALRHARSEDRDFLSKCLGDGTLSAVDFERCKTIIESSGALAYAQAQAVEHVEHALASLAHEAERWESDGVQFMESLAMYILGRQN